MPNCHVKNMSKPCCIHAGPGTQLGIHLVVVGHVDAGKSTLMGRLLHDVGVVSAKEVRQYQRDAAAAGKVSCMGRFLHGQVVPPVMHNITTMATPPASHEHMQ